MVTISVSRHKHGAIHEIISFREASGQFPDCGKEFRVLTWEDMASINWTQCQSKLIIIISGRDCTLQRLRSPPLRGLLSLPCSRRRQKILFRRFCWFRLRLLLRWMPLDGQSSGCQSLFIIELASAPFSIWIARNCSETALKTLWNCSETALKLIW